MITDPTEWLAIIRQESVAPDAAIIQKDGKWAVKKRLDAWLEAGPRIFDVHLDRLAAVIIEVLSEDDPKVTMPAEERILAGLRGKELKHSNNLRTGLSDTLALLGSQSDGLTSCSFGKAERTASHCVHKLLHKANWIRWASLNYQLPRLAEAAPDVFLDAVENALGQKPSVFSSVFGLETEGFMGGSFTTGLLWALETLAWHSDYLVRVILCLGELAAIDPGGNWGNRPSSSMADILLPWYPQTCASIAKRTAAVKALIKEQPDIGWKLLLRLLPTSHATTTGTHKPTWRKFIPASWTEGATIDAYWEQVEKYAELALSHAESSIPRLQTLVDRITEFPPTLREKLLAHLESREILSLPEPERSGLWESLVESSQKHKNYPDAKWALPADAVARLDETAAKIAPKDLLLRHRPLFGNHAIYAFDRVEDFNTQESMLHATQSDAVREILATGGSNAIELFACQVQRASQVGVALSFIATEELDALCLSSWEHASTDCVREAMGTYIQIRFNSGGWPWVDRYLESLSDSELKLKLLLLLPGSANLVSGQGIVRRFHYEVLEAGPNSLLLIDCPRPDRGCKAFGRKPTPPRIH